MIFICISGHMQFLRKKVFYTDVDNSFNSLQIFLLETDPHPMTLLFISEHFTQFFVKRKWEINPNQPPSNGLEGLE